MSWRLALLLFLDNDYYIQFAVLNALSIVGNAFIFKKCGQQWWKALIPCYKDYAEAQCADREIEGRFLFVTHIIILLVKLIPYMFGLSRILALFYVMSCGLLMMVRVVYIIRVKLGLMENFGKKRIWILPCLVIPCLPALIWGIGKKSQPQWKVPEIDKEEKTFFQNNVASLDNGLTVNLIERTARDFFRKKYLLRDIHMNIKPGSMVLLLGGSGAGKTTFINAINGYEKAKAEILLDKKNVYKEYKDMMYEIGFVPQQDLMRGTDTVLSTLLDAAALRLPRNFSRAERRTRVDEVMEIFGLVPVQRSMVSKLSGGQRKRLSIAIEFLSNPTLFILDEPDSGLDGVMARELMQQLRMIADQGKIVIVITHTPDRVVDLFDDVIVLAKDAHRTGRLVYYGSIDKAKEFFGRDKMEHIVKVINRKEEGGEGMADELIKKYAEAQNG